MAASGQATDDQADALPLRQTLRPLALAPAGALFVTGCFMVAQQNVGLYLPLVLLLVAPFVYVVELVFVVPILWLWPASRRPTFTIGAAWGAAAALGFGLALQAGMWSVPATWRDWQRLAVLVMPGIASGVLFAYLSRRN
jgi:hypothetical protein